MSTGLDERPQDSHETKPSPIPVGVSGRTGGRFPAGDPGGVSLRDHGTRTHTSRGSKPIVIAAISATSAPAANMPIPGITLASSEILISATRTPSIITSTIAQG